MVGSVGEGWGREGWVGDGGIDGWVGIDEFVGEVGVEGWVGDSKICGARTAAAEVGVES